MTTLALGITLAATAAAVLVAAGIAGNRPPLTDPPGVLARLRIYLGRNVAETGPDAALPELAPVIAAGAADRLASAVAQACRELGWHDVRVDPVRRRVSAVVRTPLLGFRDDVTVSVVPADADRTGLRVRSRSRIGRGDLGANARHVMDLVAALRAAGVVDP